MHSGITRLEIIALIRLRTGVVRLRDLLHKIQVSFTLSTQITYCLKVAACPKPHCSCGGYKQTVFHLFVECSILDTAREGLRIQTGHFDFKTWLNRDALIATRWDIQHFHTIEPDWLLNRLKPDEKPTDWATLVVV